MKKGIVHILFLLVTALHALGQQLPQFTNFTYNYINYNPAVTGATPCMEMKIGHRRQWMGIKGNPVTSFVNVHTKFKQKAYNFHGIGLGFETDAAGIFSYTSMQLNYAYHMRVHRKYMLASGIGVGFTQYRVNFGDVFMENQQNDPTLYTSATQFLRPTINIGFWLYNSDRFYGFSIRQLTSPRVKELPNTHLKATYTFASGRAIKVSDEVMFKPAVLFNYVGNSRVSVEAQALIAYKEKVTVGLGARGGNGISAMLKLDALRYITISYAYDLTLSKLKNPGSSSHELTIGMRACAEKDKLHVPCAAYD